MSRKPNRTAFLITSALLFSALCTATTAKTIYVDDDATGANNGTSWPDAHIFIQEAIDNSSDGDTVLVAPGTYIGDGNRDIDFKGKAITVRSEEGAQTCIIDCQGSENDPHRGFIFHTNEDANSILQGFTITNGYTKYATMGGKTYATYGGGIYCDASSPRIEDCVVAENTAWSGGGIACDSSNAVIANCTIIGNRAEKSRGGGVFCIYSSTHILDCLITENTALEGGGGIKCDYSDPTITRCIIRNNAADVGGGVGIGTLGSISSLLTMTNCIITGNDAGSMGGGIFCSGEITLLNCTIFGNRSGSDGGGIFFAARARRIDNSIICGNIIPRARGSEISKIPSGAAGCNPDSIKITHSVVGSDPNAFHTSFCYSGEWLYADPLFADPGYWDVNGTPNDPHDDFWVEGDYHLKSQAGRWDPYSQSWVQDEVTSPCIDTGDPNSAWEQEVWPNGERVNMGAYGGTRQASMSTQPESMSLPRVLFIHDSDVEGAESFRSLLVGYGCTTTLIELGDVATAALDSYDLVVVGDDTGFTSRWGDAEAVAAVEASGKPVVAIGEGGYAFFGQLGLSLGWPNGAHNNRNSVSVVDPNSPLFSVPYPIDIPKDKTLRLYTETSNVSIYFWPVPETVVGLGSEVDGVWYYPLALEHNRYMLWGFKASAENMTKIGRDLFVNVVIRTANAAWETGGE